MRDDADMRSLAQTIGSAALGVGIGVGVLVAGFWVSNLALAQSTTTLATASATATATPARTAAPTTAPSAAATVAPTATPVPTTTPVPTPTNDPLTVTAYTGQGLRLAAIALPAGYTMTSPIAGTVTIELYEYVNGAIVTGVSGQPTYPYIFVRSADRVIKLRPGAIDREVKMLVKDGDRIAAGAGLFTTLTTGASSWQTFYDPNVTAQVIASVTAQPSGNEVDPVPVFKR
jgi:biotin carboxyl carrier protein